MPFSIPDCCSVLLFCFDSCFESSQWTLWNARAFDSGDNVTDTGTMITDPIRGKNTAFYFITVFYVYKAGMLEKRWPSWF